MYSATLLITASLLAAIGVLGQNGTIECAEGLKMFVSRGTGEPMGLGATEALVDVIAEQINGSDIEAIEYPATEDDPLYFFSVANGTTLVKQAINNYAIACPGSKMAVFGYSQVRSCNDPALNTLAYRVVQGAQITTNTFCGTPPLWAAYAVGEASIPKIMEFAQPMPANTTKNGKLSSKAHLIKCRWLTISKTQ